MNKAKCKNIRLVIPVKGRSRSLISRDVYSYFKNVPDIMTVCDAAKAMRCSKNTLYALIKEGRLEVIKVGRCIKVPKTALVDFMVNEHNYFIIQKDPWDSLWTSGKRYGICVGEAEKSADGKAQGKRKGA